MGKDYAERFDKGWESVEWDERLFVDAHVPDFHLQVFYARKGQIQPLPAVVVTREQLTNRVFM